MGGPGTVQSNLRPLWKELDAPCMHSCPNHNDVRGAMVAVHMREKFGYTVEQAYQVAWKKIVETNPMPAICGRVCPHPCETDCNRSELEGAVGINSFERFVGDLGLEHNWQFELKSQAKRPEKIAVIGAGPGGLSAAYHLARQGYQVTVFEAFDKIGGMLFYGIPSYRLPRDLMNKELQKILDMGVELKTNCTVGKDVYYEDLQKEYQAIFVAIGAHKGKLLGIDGEEAPNVLTGAAFLNLANSGKPPEVGNDVLVVGGGDTAIDAARVCKRLGAENVTIVYRRTVKEMPAIEEEIKGAEEEHIKFHFLSAPTEFIKEGDRATGMKCIRMELTEPDGSGRRRPVPVDDSEFIIDTSMVISAISQEPDFDPLEHLREGRGWCVVDDYHRSHHGEKTYAGGDAVILATVTAAIAHGRFAAETIHKDLNGEKSEIPAAIPIIKADQMQLPFYEKKERNLPTAVSVEERLAKLDLEVNKNLSEEEILAEASRCMSCGECFRCSECFKSCPTNCLHEETFDAYNCISCNKCLQGACPTAVIRKSPGWLNQT